MNRQLTPESVMKTTIRSGFLPKLPIKQPSRIGDQNQGVFGSLDADKLQKKTKNFDFSNLGRSIQTSQMKSRGKQRSQLKPIKDALSLNLHSKQQLNKLIGNIIRAMQSDTDLQISSKHLYINSSKMSQLLMMMSGQTIDKDGFLTVHKKLYEQDIVFSLGESQNLIEFDRICYCLQFHGIPVPEQHLMQLAQLTESLSRDNDFGLIVNYKQLFTVLRQTIPQLRLTSSQQELSTTTASDDDERLSPTAKILQRALSRQQTKKVQFKQKRLGYLNEEQIFAFYDSFSDLKKRVGREWNIKNYRFGSIRFGYVDLIKYPQHRDQQTKKEIKIFGKERSQLPISFQIVYKHKSSNKHLEIALSKIFFLQTNKSQTQRDIEDFIEPICYLAASSLSNKFSLLNREYYQTRTTLQESNIQDLCLKELFHDSKQDVLPIHEFDKLEPYQVKSRQYKPQQLEIYESSDSEPDLDIYDPLYVKSIQSYPQYLIDTQIQYGFPQIYRFLYYKMFNTSRLLKDDESALNQTKVKPEHQFTEKFVNVAQVDKCPYQRHKHNNPGILDVTDEEENDLYEEPLEVLEKQDLTLTFQFQQLIKTEPDDNKTVYLKSQSSVIIQDEQKVNDKLQFAHNLSKPFICQQDCYAFMLRLRFPLTIHMQSIPFEVSKAIPIKEINFEASTVIIDNTLTFEQSILDIDTAPILDADSEEEPSFDEDPLEIDLPEIDEQQQVEEKIEEDEDQTIEKVTQFVDLEIKENITIEVKGEYVSKIIIDNYPVYFFLNEKLRKQEPQIHSISMEGKEIQSIQLTTEEVQDQKIYLKSFALRALCDQRLESNQIQNQQQGNFEKKPTMEENELNIYEEVQLQEGWNLGQFVVHMFYPSREDILKSADWLKQTLIKHFPNIIFFEDLGEGFEAYIYGVGPVNKRDGSKRILLMRKDIEDWEQFIQEFQYRSLLIYDTLCCLINVYGSVTYLSIAQDKFFNVNFSKYSKTRVDKNHLNPYKYVENIERERNRPTTGYKSVGRRL